jgi:leucyl aminopeptidase (aminopeptidase T)
MNQEDKGAFHRGVANLISCLGDVHAQSVAVLVDPGTDEALCEETQQVLRSSGAQTRLVELPASKGTDAEVPAPVAAQLTGLDAVVEITTVSVRHSQARQDLQQDGTRYLYVGSPPRNLFDGTGAMYADFPTYRQVIERLADRVTAGSNMSITTARGTDLSVDLDQRFGRALTGMADRAAMFGTPPCLEWGLVPSLSGTTGQLIADAYGVGLGLLSEPIHAQIEDGRMVHIARGREGDRLRDLLASAQTPHAYQVSEVGVGMNPEAQMIDDMMSAEAVLGTAHIAVGTTPADPGVERVQAGLHIDLVFWHPTITIDEEIVMDQGQLVDGR